MTFPADLPDLLRTACKADGRLRLHMVFSAEKKWQAGLANSGQGWTVDHREDCLEAMTVVLRTRFGKMLERQRGDAEPTEVSEVGVAGWEVEDGVMFALTRRGFSDDLAAEIALEVLDRIWGKDAQPNLHPATYINGVLEPAPEVDEFAALL